ncbi:MAG TPA: nucleoside phosphorylase [Thermoplasmata archaeon]|nr:nucleoside phosphorylase [Thermoplasmata archaeon]
MVRKATFPRFAAKVHHPSIIEPAQFAHRYLPGVRAPPRCLLVWQRGLAPRLARRFRGRRIPGLDGTYAVPATPYPVGVSFPRGVGGPSTVVRCEELAALGTKEFIGVGFAGSLSPELHPGDVIVCDGAVRDEGTSHHYAHASVPALPSAALLGWVTKTLAESSISSRTGPSWTTDAPYRETGAELRHYRGRGVLTVEMEAAALFIFARHRGLRAASVFVVSDVLTEERWEPHFHRMGGTLEKVATAILRASRRAEGQPV